MCGNGCSQSLLVLLVLLAVEPRPCSASGWARHGESSRGVFGFGVDDGVDGDVKIGVDTSHGGVAEDREVLARHVDPLLRVPIGEGERLPPVNVWRGAERLHPLQTPRIVAVIKVLLGYLDLLGGEGVDLQVSDKLVEGGVGVLQENGLGGVGTDAVESAAEVTVGPFRHTRDRLRRGGVSGHSGAEVERREAG